MSRILRPIVIVVVLVLVLDPLADRGGRLDDEDEHEHDKALKEHRL